MNRAEYQDLRHRYRRAQREDAQAQQMNASEWKRGIHQDTAGVIRAQFSPELAKTLEHRDATACYVASYRLRAALGRYFARRQKAATTTRRQSVVAEAMARTRALDAARTAADNRGSRYAPA